jgi:hypothetical protein
MASINAHQKTGGGIWFFDVDGYDGASFAKLRTISPLFAVHKDMPPFLEIHGTRDDQVPYEQSTLLCEAMRKVAVPATSSPSKPAGTAWARGRTPTSSTTRRKWSRG